MSLRIIIFFIFSFLPLTGFSEIYTANTVAEINNSIINSVANRNPQKALVIIPLEHFLIEPSDDAFYAKNEKLESIIRKLIKKIKSSKREYLEELILTEYGKRFSDPSIPDFMKNLRKINIPLIVVTKNTSGNFNNIPYLEVWTVQYLREQGIDISQSPIGMHQIIFDKQFKKVKGTYPTFFNGLLSCNTGDNENSPQSIITSLLAINLKLIPKIDIVYIIDKNEGYIKSLKQQFQSIRSDIQVEGYVYSPIYKNNVSIDPKEYKIFWEKLIDKLNLVSRKEISGQAEDPYER